MKKRLVPILVIAVIFLGVITLLISRLSRPKSTSQQLQKDSTTGQGQSITVQCEADSCSYRGACVKNGAKAQLPEGTFVCLGSDSWQDPSGTVTNSLPRSASQLQPRENKLIRNIPTVNPTTLSDKTAYLSTAKRVLDWIGTQKNERGVYLSGVNCSNESGDCAKPVDNPRVAPQVMWARFQYVKATGDETELNNINADLKALMALYDDPDYRISYLNNLPVCSMLYELAQSDKLSPFVKRQMQDLCKKSVFAIAEAQEADEKIAQNKIVEPRIQQVMDGQKLPYDQIINKTDFLNGYYTYAVSVSDLSTQYKWFKDDKQLLKAKHLFDKALQVYSNERDGELLKGKPDTVIGLAALDLYAATGETKYHDFATYVANQKNESSCISTDDCTAFALLLDKLLAQSATGNFKLMHSQIVAKLISSAFDSEVGAFDSMSKFVRKFNVQNNALSAGILSNYAVIL